MASNANGLVVPSDREAEDRRKAIETFVASVVTVAIVSFFYWLLLLNPAAGGLSHGRISQLLQFAGSQDRLGDRLAGVTLGEARWAVATAGLFALVWGPGGYLLLVKWWHGAWKTGIGRQIEGKSLARLLAAGGATVALVEKAFTLVSIESVGVGVGVGYEGWLWSALPKIIVTLAWVKWLLAAGLILAAVAMTVSAATAFARTKLSAPDPALDPDSIVDQTHVGVDPPDVAGTGISCSGGGIRAASFALGCLSRLEQEPVPATAAPARSGQPGGSPPNELGILGRSKYLASVSGGGYAAAAWRIAAGQGALPDEPVIGNPLDPQRYKKLQVHLDSSSGSLDLLHHIRRRRHFLANGPGGLLRSGIRAIGASTFHFLLVIMSVAALAWPLGWLAVSWAVTDAGRSPDVIGDGLPAYRFGVHQWLPPVALLVAAVAAMALRLGAEKTRRRNFIDLAIKGSIGIAAALFVVLIGLPWTIDRFSAWLPSRSGDQVALAGIYGTVVTATWRFASAQLKPVARYLGGVLLAIGLGLFAVYIMASAASTERLLSSPWAWAAITFFMIFAFVAFNPDRWSLHSIYRDGLVGTFATERKPDGVHPLSGDMEETLALASYQEADGPIPIICCAAARDDNRETGIKVLSMTFDPHRIVVHGWCGRGLTAEPDPQSISHAEFRRRLPRGSFGIGLQTVIGIAAISGAAVAPSLGRMDMKSTNALLAAFNARLGVWVPNPTQRYTRSTTPRLVNMFKEIGQMFAEDDPNVYATDGGHWENLGVVELIRRRCATIICIDTSGDPPGTYKTFKDAIELARLECQAEIKVDDAFWEPLMIGTRSKSKVNYARSTVVYIDGQTAELLYVKAAVAESSPIHIQRYASSDLKFPDYSTGNQLLGGDEFHYLTQLGYDSMDKALAAHPQFAARTFLGA